MRQRVFQILRKRRNYLLVVMGPVTALALYYALYASDRYVSTARLIVESDEAMAVATVALGILGTGQGEAEQDGQLVRSFILSPSMLAYLDEHLQLRAHYSQDHIDWFSRLSADASRESFLSHYLGLWDPLESTCRHASLSIL